MAVSLTLRQATAVLPPIPPATAPVYRVKAEITDAMNIDEAVFVYATASRQFSHYATVADLERWANDRTQAMTNGDPFYRLSTVSRDWPTVALLTEDLKLARNRLQLLVNEMNAAELGVLLDVTTIISST